MKFESSVNLWISKTDVTVSVPKVWFESSVNLWISKTMDYEQWEAEQFESSVNLWISKTLTRFSSLEYRLRVVWTCKYLKPVTDVKSQITTGRIFQRILSIPKRSAA